MKICAYAHVHRTITPTGVGLHIAHMVSGLAARPGFEVTVLAPHRDLEPGGQIRAESALAGLPVKSFSISGSVMERSWRLLDWPKADRWCPDADWVYCPAEAYVATRKRLAVTVHDLHAFEPDLPWSNTPGHRNFRMKWSILFRKVLSRADLLLAVSEFTKRRLVELLGAHEKKITVVGNGVNDAFFAAADDANLAPAIGVQSPYLLVLGGLTARKGAPHVLAMAQELARMKSDLRVYVAGFSEPQFIAEAAAIPNVTDLHYVNPTDLPTMIKGAAALVFLSRYEGFGIPAVEAMAVGTPAIVSNFAALPDIVGGAGVVVDVNQPVEIARAAEKLLRDTAFRENHIQIGRERAKQFRWNACVTRLADALEKAS